MARENLKAARNEKGMTQQQVADHLGISLRHYQQVEYAEVIGAIWIWDALEDLFGEHQRVLRQVPPETQCTRPDQGASRATGRENQQ